ncbi:MAG TPA: hypothetical protein VD994_10690, partial [Prosthecobacter sp.]|nr:hypothetical protein [Prosthecobacter sp.]
MKSIRCLVCPRILSLWLAALYLPAVAQDSDGDGLTDFQEVHKYLTNPALAETEAGKVDGDWQQRREFTYSIRSVVRVLKPYDVAAMQDDYQDARLLRETAEYGEVEVIHYPLNTLTAAAAAHLLAPATEAELSRWRKPGITTDWTPELRQQLLLELKAAGIDPKQLTPRELVEKVAGWMQRSCAGSSVFTTFFIDFSKGHPELLPGCEEAYEREKGTAGWTFDEQLRHEVLGSGMFAAKTRGTCTSSAIYWTTVMRALGIPARQILCIPAVDGNDRAQVDLVRNGITHHRVRQTMLAGV